MSLGAGQGLSGGFSAGLVPGMSLSRNWQTEDDVAIRLTEVARGLESLLNTASHEGGFMTTALLLASDAGERAAQALVPQAFHGPGVPTPVLTVPGDPTLRDHALAFRPSLAPDGDPFRLDLLWSKWGTLLTPAMLAAYTSPNLFEEGTAVTIQEKLPPLAFYPELPGEVVLGHQVSPETGDLTSAPLRLSRDAHFHTAFCGDTGYGKSVAAVRLAYETTLHWQLKTIVLDFGAGWRQLLNAPGLAGPRGNPPALARRRAALALEPAADRPQHPARSAVARLLGYLRHHRPTGRQAPDPRAARDPAQGLPGGGRPGGRPRMPQRPGLGAGAPRRSCRGRCRGRHAAGRPGSPDAPGAGCDALA